MSSPLRRPQVPLSSSPLPSLDQILSQIKKPDIPTAESPRMFTTASSFIRPDPNPIDLTTPVRAPSEPIEVDDEVVVVKILPSGLRKRRKQGIKKLLEWKTLPKPETTTPKDDKPWRKYQETPSPDSKKTKKTRGKAKQEEVVRSRHFETKEEPEEEPEKKKRAKKEPRPKASHEPLLLAPAERRRADWTPPPANKVIELSSSAPLAIAPSSAQDPKPTAVESGQSFGSLLEAYGLAEEEPVAEAVAGPGPVTEMLRKRKLAEAAAKEAEALSKDTSPVKKPAKKRKPRTITEVATAAYAMPEPEPAPTVSMLDYLAPDPAAGDKSNPDGKKARKPRPKKAKPLPPPEPILLSPGTAIRQVYAQDFVFGTSSQLVLGDMSPVLVKPRAPPPMFADEDPFATPINSDVVEPEPKKKLWEVGARDEDGRLLDLPVINLVEEMDVDAMGLEINPFGYAGARPIQKKEETPQLEDPFLSSDPPEPKRLSPKSTPLPEPKKVPPKTATLPAEASVAGLGQAAYTPPNTIPTSQQPAEATPSIAITAAPVPKPTGPPRPKYDLFTDAQLAREVAKFGFKSIKRRTAMLALLDQCWESKNGSRAPLSPLPSNRSMSTTAATSAPAKVATSPKKPRGRPRKASTAATVELDRTEPPPSGQPAESPKKPRGRPRKDASVGASPTRSRGRPRRDESPAASPSRSRGRPRKDASPAASPEPRGQPRKDASPVASPKPRGRPRKVASPVRKPVEAAPKTPEKRKRAAPKTKAKGKIVIEIPDSEADDSDDMDVCASSPGMTFSSPGDGDGDVTLSLDDKMEGSLAMGADTDQSSLMACITQAVRSAPPTTDPTQPSWHEKMLMYEPVILEDLAAWLNTGPLTGAGYDGEVSPGEVKQWCESKSVCCLWRMNISGKERKRF